MQVAPNVYGYLNNTNFPHRLSHEQKETCERKVTIEHCNNVVQNLKPNKSPGLDGLINEFYKALRHVTGELLVKCSIEFSWSVIISFVTYIRAYPLSSRKGMQQPNSFI